MIFRIPVGARYFEVVVCENIERTIKEDKINRKGKLNYICRENLDKYIKEGYTIKFNCIVLHSNHIWTKFICQKEVNRQIGKKIKKESDESGIECMYFGGEKVEVCLCLLTKITFIDKTLLNKNIAKFIGMYSLYMNTHKLMFLSNDIYRILFNLKNDWTPYGNVIRNFKFFSENMRRKVSNEDEFRKVILSSIINICNMENFNDRYFSDYSIHHMTYEDVYYYNNKKISIH